MWGRALPPLHISMLWLTVILINAWGLTWAVLEMFVIGPMLGVASAGDDWAILARAGGIAAAGGDPYSVDLFRWNPLMAWVMAGLTTGMLFSLWTALHAAALLTLPRLIGGAVALSWPFWFDVGVGNVMAFVFVAAWWTQRGNRSATIVFLAMSLLMPRPLMLPLLVWVLWHRPWTRWAFAALAVLIGAATMATGLADEFVGRILSTGSELNYVLNLAPSRWIGGWWAPLAVVLAAWLTWKGRIGLASVTVQPYLIPNYLIMALLDMPGVPRRARGTPHPQSKTGRDASIAAGKVISAAGYIFGAITERVLPRRRTLLREMRFLLIVVLVVVLIGAGMKLAGQRLPFIDYPIGSFGGTVGGPQIEIHPPGYDVPLGQ